MSPSSSTDSKRIRILALADAIIAQRIKAAFHIIRVVGTEATDGGVAAVVVAPGDELAGAC
jgi:hypothetical protein